MTLGWIEEAIPNTVSDEASADAVRTRIADALDIPVDPFDERSVSFAQQAWELALFDALEDPDADADSIRQLAEHAFQLLRVLPPPRDVPDASRFLARIGCLGLLADRQADAGRVLSVHALPTEDAAGEWGQRAETVIWNAWLRLIRKSGWEDFDAVTASIDGLRGAQEEFGRATLLSRCPRPVAAPGSS
jgi:hypothetical protein